MNKKIENRSENWKNWIAIFTVGLLLILVYKLLDNFTQIGEWLETLFSVLAPFLVGLLIAYLLYMPCRGVEKLYKKTKKKNFINKHARVLSVATVYIVAVLIIIVALTFVIPAIIDSAIEFINNIQNYYNEALQAIDQLPAESFLKSDIITNAIARIQDIDLERFTSLESIISYLKGAVNIVSGIFNAFVAFVVSIYILVERKQILSFLKKLARAIFKKDTYLKVGEYFNRANEIFFKFLATQFLDGIIIGILVSIAMSIIGVKYAVLLGFMIGLFNLIPYFGAIIAVIVAVIVTIFTGGIGQAIIMAIVVIVLQQIDANVINPKIVGSSLKMSPLLVIFAVTVGGAYFGVLGMFLSVPVMAVIKLLVTEFIEYKNKKNGKIKRQNKIEEQNKEEHGELSEKNSIDIEKTEKSEEQSKVNKNNL